MLTNTSPIPIFISSTVYGLEDLRSELAQYIEEFGAAPFLSSEKGFRATPGMKPYAGCLSVLEKSMIVIVVLDRRYGTPFGDWGPYPQYKNLSPTHAEIRHAVAHGKQLLVYVRDSLRNYYDVYRKSDKPNYVPPNGVDIEMLKLFEEVSLTQPFAPWIEPFKTSLDIKTSIRKNLLAILHDGLLQEQKLREAGTVLLIKKILALEPGLRAEVSRLLENGTPDSIPEELARTANTRQALGGEGQLHSAEGIPVKGGIGDERMRVINIELMDFATRRKSEKAAQLAWEAAKMVWDLAR